MTLVYIILILGIIWLLIEIITVAGAVIIWACVIMGVCIALYLGYLLLQDYGMVIVSAFNYLVVGVAVVLVLFLAYTIMSVIVGKIRLSSEVSKYVNWLDAVGIGPFEHSPGNHDCWKQAEKDGRSAKLNEDYSISVAFSEAVVNKVHQVGMISQSELWPFCKTISPEFQIDQMPMLMDVLQETAQVKVLTPPNQQRYCLTTEILAMFEQLVLEENGTMQDYIASCSDHEETAFITGLDETLVCEIIRCLVDSKDEVVASKARSFVSPREHEKQKLDTWIHAPQTRITVRMAIAKAGKMLKRHLRQ